MHLRIGRIPNWISRVRESALELLRPKPPDGRFYTKDCYTAVQREVELLLHVRVDLYVRITILDMGGDVYHFSLATNDITPLALF